MCRVVAPYANNFPRLDRGQQSDIRERKSARTTGPRTPRRRRNLSNLAAFDQAIKSRVQRRVSGITWKKSADFHSRSAQMVIRMRFIRRSGATDDGSNPRERNQQQIEHGAQYKNLYGAEASGKSSKVHTENAGSQQVSRHPPESQCGNQRNQTEQRDSSKVTHQRKGIENRNAIGHDHPAAEYNR